MASSDFNVDYYQKRLVITTEDDVPFQLINREIQDCDFNDLVAGREYYLLSNAWYNRWSFYYQEVGPALDRSNIQSTKMLMPLDSHRTKKRRKTLNGSGRRYSDITLRTSELSNTLIEQPNTINFDDIEGEYKGELKESLKMSVQIRIITDSLWKLLCSLHPPEQ